MQSDISSILALENISADIPSYDQTKQEYTFVMSDLSQTLQPGESIESMFYVQLNDTGSAISSSSIDIYANEGQLTITLSSSENTAPEFSATITSLQGDVEITQSITDPISLPGAESERRLIKSF